MVTTVKVPPDGGYGWIIVLASAISSFIVVPMMQTFGLIFKDTFAEMGLSATEGSFIINLNAAFGMIMGLVNGVLLKVFGYRKVAMASSFFISIGIMLTSYAHSLPHFIITYGLITSLGFGMNRSAYSLASNMYFQKKKAQAVGYSVTIMGLGPIIMPQVINMLLKFYSVEQTTLILGAIACNCFVAASLLQPVKWHMKTQIVEDKLEPEQEEEEEPKEEKIETKVTMYKRENSRKTSIGSFTFTDDLNNVLGYGLDSEFTGSVISLPRNRKESVISQSWKKGSTHSITNNSYYKELNITIEEPSCWSHFATRMVNFFDLDLLKDPIYINIMVGLSLAVFAELTFSLLTAFILAEFGLNTNEIATFMSVLGIADIVFRFLAPTIGGFLKLSVRTLYLITLVMLMLTRFSLLISNNFKILLAVALGLGIAKGIRTVYMSLVIPMYVPIEKLPSALGLQMMLNGLCILIGGPVIGKIRDITGSYTLCIVVLNIITCTTIVLWSIEGIVVRLKKKKDIPEKPIEQADTLLEN